MIRVIKKLISILIISISPVVAYSDEASIGDKVLHFDQPQAPLTALNFKHDNELKPDSNDFHIIEASYLSNDLGERWAFVTIENQSSGQRLLKNKEIVATFVDGFQSYAHNLNITLKGNEHLTKAIYFGIHRFPIVSVVVE